MGFVHTGCLEAFRQQKLQTTGERPTSCEICKREYDEYWLSGAPQQKTSRWDALCQTVCLWVVPFVALGVFGNIVTLIPTPLVFPFGGSALVYLISYLLECLLALHPQCPSGRQLHWGVLLLLAFFFGANGSAWSNHESALLSVCGLVVLLPISLKAHDHFRMHRRLLAIHRGQEMLQQAGRQQLCVFYGFLQSSHTLAVACYLSRVLALISATFGWISLASSLMALMAVWRHRSSIERHLVTYFLPAHYQCAACRAKPPQDRLCARDPHWTCFRDSLCTAALCCLTFVITSLPIYVMVAPEARSFPWLELFWPLLWQCAKLIICGSTFMFGDFLLGRVSGGRIPEWILVLLLTPIGMWVGMTCSGLRMGTFVAGLTAARLPALCAAFVADDLVLHVTDPRRAWKRATHLTEVAFQEAKAGTAAVGLLGALCLTCCLLVTYGGLVFTIRVAGAACLASIVSVCVYGIGMCVKMLVVDA
ncbi:unnamed protein product [Vitrella brassicaformis CCMP3155]|uniref:RING-CH-type domain-containing protein n=1 Tax=Vitrella brassicaformis (strain CCMP3155) TaxID=1169540 RepID=A0A0G4F6N7_VITBC|nr:unnamed protein product [Vitrella brassicaformis CCMP3155]|eukprot:CEM08091.1 unnamed protein product [Vitrella brassicaformis CCMP3155]